MRRNARGRSTRVGWLRNRTPTIPFKPSKNEVAYLHERLKGLVTIKHKKDCLDLPDKRYRKIICKPTASLCRVAESIVAFGSELGHRHDAAP